MTRATFLMCGQNYFEEKLKGFEGSIYDFQFNNNQPAGN